MSKSESAVPGATEQPTDPFSGFKSEAYDRDGTVVELVPPPAAPAPAEPPSADPSAADPDAGDEAAETGDDGQPKPKKTAQERINDLTRARRTAERERDELRSRLAALEQSAPKSPPAAAAPAAEVTDPDAPDPNDAEKYPLGEIEPQFVRDLARHEAKKAYAEERAADQQTRHRDEFTRKRDALVTAGVEKHSDFKEVVMDGEWALSVEMGRMLVDSDAGPDIAYYLAANPDEAAEVYAKSPVEQARYFGRMEAKFSATQEAAKTEVHVTAKSTNAPAPIFPARGAGGKFQPSAATGDFKSFEARVNGESRR